MIEPDPTQQRSSLRSRLGEKWKGIWRSRPEFPGWLRIPERFRPLVIVAAVALVFASFGGWLASCGFGGCPTAADIRRFRPAEGSRVLDRSGTLLGRLSYVHRVNVPLSKVPLVVRRAFIATEDRRFYEHHGIDWRGVVRAAVHNVRAGGVREGFSTITMQVARNGFTALLPPRRTLRRKLIEIRLARLIEQNLTKDQILELYLNVIYLGNGTYGVEAASLDLFGKNVSELSLDQAAMLAALPKGPSSYTPRNHPERARRRRDLVLSLMADEGYITPERAHAAAAKPLVVAKKEWDPPRTTSYVVGAVRTLVDSVLGDDADDIGDVTVFTTIDARAQRAAENAVRKRAAYIDRLAGAGNGDHVQAAFVAIDPANGDVRALVGGRTDDPGGFNRALSARRQPGSAFKPFVYAAALAVGYTPATVVEDEPVSVPQPGGVWTPANYGNEYTGTITMRRALALSSNAAAVRFSRAVGEARVVDRAHANGISSPLAPVPSLALGAVEVTPIELVTAYAPFANGGFRVHPRLVRRIEAGDGTVLWSSDIAPRDSVLDPRDAFQITSMLESVVDDGTGRTIRTLGARGPIAGKTGTTNDGTDTWFVGYTPSLVAGIWFGYDTPRSMGAGATGGRYAAPAWADFYTHGWPRGARDEQWLPPPGMVSRIIDADDGLLATEWCPLTRREWFRAGTEPTSYCAQHTGPPDLGDSIGDRIVKLLKGIFKF